MFLGISLATAQPTTPQDSVEIEVEGNKITLEMDNLEALSALDLNKMIKEVVEKTTKIQMQQEMLLNRVDKQLEAGEITEEQAEEMKEEINERTEESMEVIGELMETWGEAYGERWEEWAEEYESKMEAWEDQVEAREDGITELPPLPALPPLPDMEGMPEMPDMGDMGDTTKGKKQPKVIISPDGITIEEGEEGDKPFALEFEDSDDRRSEERKAERIDRTETYLDIHLGFNQLLEDGQFQVFDEPAEQDFWKSTTFELGMGGKTRLGSPYSKLYLKWGGEFSWHNFRLRGSNILEKQSGDVPGAAFINDTTRDISKSKFEIVYFNIPLMLQLDLSELGDIDESFTLGVGGYGGVRLGSRRRLEYNDFEGAEVKEEIRNDYFTNPFRYGVMAQVGWKSLKITAKYDLSTYFEVDKDFNNNYQMASINIGFTL